MRKSIFTAVALLILSNCSTPKVIHFLNDEMDYSTYHSYRLVNYKSSDKSYAKEGKALFEGIEKAIAKNMDLKNYVAADLPDLTVRYEIISTITSSSNQNNSSYNSAHNDPYGTPYVNTKKITEGIILIEFRDKKLQKLVWQGSLDLKYSKKKEIIIMLEEAIEQIFTSYPYEAGSNLEIKPQ